MITGSARNLILIALLFLFPDAGSGAESISQSALTADYRRYVTAHVLPEYPVRGQRLPPPTSQGIAWLKIDRRTGQVKSVSMLHSTGSKALDRIVVRAYLRWRFIPDTIAEARVPAIFTHPDRTLFTIHSAQALALRAPRPTYPLFARERRWTGAGVAILEINRDTGNVVSVSMGKSTGHKILDQAALAAFRQWRFKPGTVTKVKIPIRFSMGGAEY